MDPYKNLGIILNPDGSLDRTSIIIPPSLFNLNKSSPSSSTPQALSKCIPLDPSHKTLLRLYLPEAPSPSGIKLPLILYIHGGGFIIGSPDTPTIHHSCLQMSAGIPALIVSLPYRLAPEHRLPAAYHDAVTALVWCRHQAVNVDSADPWIKHHADFSNCFIMGSSAGANIAYRLALHSLGLDLQPLHITGVILSQPFFGGVERTESEMRSADDKILPLAANDLMWELALPDGSDRDHEYCNPMMTIAKARGLPRCFVKGFVGDPLLDRMREFVKALEGEGVSVTAMMEDEGFHGIEYFDAEKAEMMTAEIRSFVYR